jgi:hypothetical protein
VKPIEKSILSVLIKHGYTVSSGRVLPCNKDGSYIAVPEQPFLNCTSIEDGARKLIVFLRDEKLQSELELLEYLRNYE